MRVRKRQRYEEKEKEKENIIESEKEAEIFGLRWVYARKSRLPCVLQCVLQCVLYCVLQCALQCVAKVGCTCDVCVCVCVCVINKESELRLFVMWHTIKGVCIETFTWYGVATISRLLKIIGLFCKRDL